MREGQLAAGPLQPSGRVIAGGRLLLAGLFLIAVWADSSQPARAHVATYVLLNAYVAWSLGLTLLVWNDWWQDARLAAPAHVIDVAVFMIMLYATEGYTSPYFVFFVFILLAAAIRWGWQETAVTAAAVIAVYFTVALMLGPSPQFDIQRFIVRTGHLVIISAILIWFGANRWIAWHRPDADGSAVPLGSDPFTATLRAAMAWVGARRATLYWRESDDEEGGAITIKDGVSRSVAVRDRPLPQVPASILFDMRKDRVLMRADASRWRFLRASDILPNDFRRQFDTGEGLAIPIATGAAEGLAVFEDVRALSTDHLDSAQRVAQGIAERLQSAALFAAAEERSMAKARVAVARDLHDSVVQFLAGLGFRLEALNRSPEASGALGPALAELKESVMAEQRHLRAFIRGLRTGGIISVDELSADCTSLCELLARQWNIDCDFTCDIGDRSIPVRTQLDIQHLLREAVANSVRHGSAKRVSVSLSGEENRLSLSVADDGLGFTGQPASGKKVAPPASLSGRVREARGQLKVQSSADGTSILIHLPLDAAA